MYRVERPFSPQKMAKQGGKGERDIPGSWLWCQPAGITVSRLLDPSDLAT